MSTIELLELIAGGEDSYTEFKRDISQRSDFAAEMVAFANTQGGQILVGIDDDSNPVGVMDVRQTEEAIINLGIDGQVRLSIAGLLLFGKKPQDFFPHAFISAVRWAGLVAGETILDRQEIGGRLAQQIEQAEAFILRNTRLTSIIEGARQLDIPEYPRAALREALVNAVAHRDYSLTSAQILLYIFEDRIELRSPGGLPNSVTLDNIRTHNSKPRNETIARVLFNLGYVNRLGSGIPRMIRLMEEHTERSPDFEISSAQFLVRLWSKWWQNVQTSKLKNRTATPS